MKNNKGFSLVELIIVIAIMAILVGVMAPQLIKYIEKTNVSSDTQLCDTVKNAITTAIMDPTIIANDADGIAALSTTAMASVATDFGGGDPEGGDTVKDAVAETLGFDPADIDNHLKSTYDGTKATGVKYQIVGANSVHVTVESSDATGKKGKDTSCPKIYVD